MGWEGQPQLVEDGLLFGIGDMPWPGATLGDGTQVAVLLETEARDELKNGTDVVAGVVVLVGVEVGIGAVGHGLFVGVVQSVSNGLPGEVVLASTAVQAVQVC